jgi:ribonuclease D
MPELPAIPPALYVRSDEELKRIAHTLAQVSLLAVDTESNSLFAYQERVCLVQISTSEADYVIDPLVVEDMSPLAPLMASPAIEKVFHAAEYDVMCMKRDFGYEFRNLFDTLIAVRVLGYKSVGLSSLLEMHLNVTIDKTHQRDDWRERPLTPEKLLYAQTDTHYLPRLRDQLYAELVEHGRLEEAIESFEEVSNAPSAPQRAFDPEGYWDIGRPAFLRRGEMKILRELYLLREEAAMERDLPAFKIMSNRTLLELARLEPRHLDDLIGVEGMTTSQIRRYGNAILDAVERGEKAPRRPAPPRPRAPSPLVMDRYMALHAWRKDRGLQRGVDSDVILSKQALWDIAQISPATLQDLEAITSLGPWRRKTYGQELLDVLERFRQTQQ